MKNFFFFFLPLLISFCSVAQTKKLDSLLLLIKTDKEDSNKVIHLNSLSWEFEAIGDNQNSLEYGKQALRVANKQIPLNTRGKMNIAMAFYNIGNAHFDTGNYTESLNNFQNSLNIYESLKNKTGVANVYNNMGNIYSNQGNNLEAIKFYKNALGLYQETNAKLGVANSYNNIATIYTDIGVYPEALKNNFAAIKIREEIDDKIGVSTSYMNIGNVYNHQSNYSEALKYYGIALKKSEEINDKLGIAYCYGNIGTIYESQKKYSEALTNHFMSLKIFEEMDDKFDVSGAYTNLGTVYMAQGKYDQSLKNYFASLKIKEELDDKIGIVGSNCNIGEVLTLQKNFKEAEKYLFKAKELAKKIRANEFLRNTYECLAILNEGTRNYKSEIENYKLFIIYRDSIDNNETKKRTVEQSMNYAFEKKELEAKAEQEKKDVLVRDEKQRQKIITYSISTGLILVLLLALFIFRGLRQKQKANAIITLQKMEVESQKHLIEEKHHEITDSINYAERIQRAMLASKQLLNENSTLLSADIINGEDGYFVFFQPKDVVSGDFYWASKLGSNQFCLVTADSTGHGVPGAIMSMLNMNSLKEAVTKGLTEADEILNYTRKIIINTLANDGSEEGGKDGMDCSLLIFDYAIMNLNWCAANNPVWIVRNAGQSNIELIELKPQKMPVGKHDRQNEPFIKQTIQLQQGDHIYTITDGFPDQFGGEKGKKFMSKNLKELLASNAHLPMHEQKSLLEKTFKNWVGDLEQVDDVTIIGIRV